MAALALVFIAGGCDKSSLTGSRLSSHTPKASKKSSSRSFFTHADSTNKLVKTAIDTLRHRDSTHHFTTKFIKKRGYPVWSAAQILSQSGGLVALVPVVRPQRQTVTGIFDIMAGTKGPALLDHKDSVRHLFYFHWIPRGARLKGKNRPGKHVLEVFMLGFEKAVFGTVQKPGIIVESKTGAGADTTGQQQTGNAARDTLGIPKLPTRYVRIQTHKTCYAVQIPGAPHPPIGTGNWTQSGKRYANNGSVNWHCTYSYAWVWRPSPSGGYGGSGDRGGGGGGSGGNSNNNKPNKPCKTTANKVSNALNGNVDQSNLDSLVTYVNKYGGLFGLTNKYEIQHFYAQAAYESTNLETGKRFGALQEDLNYSAQRLKVVYPTKFSGSDPKYDVAKYAHSPRNLAKLIFGHRKDLGNTKNGDGYKFRGSGYLMFTGRSNVKQFTSYYDKHFGSELDFSKHPNLLRTNKKMAALSAMWHWLKYEAGDAGKNGSTKALTKDIRNTYKSWKRRKKLFDDIKRYIANCLNKS